MALPDPDLGALFAEAFPRERTALLIVDVQNDFCAPGGFFDQMGHPLDMVQAAVGRLERFLPQARAAGITPIFVRAVYDDAYISDVKRSFFARVGYPLRYCLPGEWGSEFFGVAPEPDDLVVVKRRYSAFIDTDLPLLLRSRGITSLMICGVATNVCVESTARDAFMSDFHVLVVSDCSGTYDRALHDATMQNIRLSFGAVAASDEIVRAWETVAPAQPTALVQPVA